MLFKRELRTRFDKLRPRTGNIVYDKEHAQIVSRKGCRKAIFEEGDAILTNNRGKGDERIEGTIFKQLSPSTYQVELESSKS